MAENEKPHGIGGMDALPVGLLIHGKIISSIARVIQKKDRSGVLVKIQHELALTPGVAIWEEYIDPTEDKRVKVQGDEVKKFPALQMLTDVLLKVVRHREYNRQMYFSAEPIR